MLTALRKKMSQMGVLLTLILGLFAAAPSLDAFACEADENVPARATVMSALTTQGESTRESGGQHRCYCAGHCCPAGVVVEPAHQPVHLIVEPGTQLTHFAEAIVRQAPQALERPPRA
jgi:hypothetical protein